MNIYDAVTTLVSHPALAERPLDAAAINSLYSAQALCYDLAKYAGWHDNVDYTDKREVATKLCLIHSEISEAMEGHRKGLPDSHLPDRPAIEVELADAVIRIFDLAGALDLDLGGAVIRKLAYNARRKDHTREARAQPGGKAY